MVFAEDDGGPPAIKAPNAVYTELLGQGILLSVNYDRRLGEHISVRAGVAVVGLGFGVPVSVSFLSSGDHKFEMGAGLLYATATNGFEKIEGVAGSANIGYRYQPRDGGFMFRIGFTPLLGSGGLLPWGGASFGICF